MMQKISKEDLTDLKDLMQSLSNEHNAIITIVIHGEHLYFTPKNTISLTEVALPGEYLEEGE